MRGVKALKLIDLTTEQWEWSASPMEVGWNSNGSPMEVEWKPNGGQMGVRWRLGGEPKESPKPVSMDSLAVEMKATSKRKEMISFGELRSVKLTLTS